MHGRHEGRDRRRMTRRDDVILSTVVGLAMATLYSGWVAVGAILGGGRNVRNAEVGFGAIVASYYAAGVIGGALVGTLLPLGRSLPGRLLLGCIAAFTACFCVLMAMNGPFWHWGARNWRGLFVLSGLFGVIGGAGWKRLNAR